MYLCMCIPTDIYIYISWGSPRLERGFCLWRAPIVWVHISALMPFFYPFCSSAEPTSPSFSHTDFPAGCPHTWAVQSFARYRGYSPRSLWLETQMLSAACSFINIPTYIPVIMLLLSFGYLRIAILPWRCGTIECYGKPGNRHILTHSLLSGGDSKTYSTEDHSQTDTAEWHYFYSNSEVSWLAGVPCYWVRLLFYWGWIHRALLNTVQNSHFHAPRSQFALEGNI